jgi:hypothetical protein
MTGQSIVRRAEDIGGQELSYAEVKAIASGNPAVLTLAEADAELQRLAILRKNHADEQYLARRSLRELPETIARLTKRVADLTADLGTLAAHDRDPLSIGGQHHAEEDAVKPLARQLNAIPDRTHETRRYPLGTYRGLAFGIVVNPIGAPDVYLEGATTRHAMIARDAGARAVLNALGRLAGGYDAQLAGTRKDLAIAEGQLRDYRARLGQPFAHEDYLRELTDLRDRLKAGLSQAAPEPGAPPVPVAELAERIKALKSAHTIEAAPERTAPRRIAAEEPVTARIRRRTAQEPATPAEPEPLASLAVIPPADASAGALAKEEAAPAAPAEEPPAVIPLFPEGQPAAGPQPAYRPHAARARRQGDRQLSLF